MDSFHWILFIPSVLYLYVLGGGLFIRFVKKFKLGVHLEPLEFVYWPYFALIVFVVIVLYLLCSVIINFFHWAYNGFSERESMANTTKKEL